MNHKEIGGVVHKTVAEAMLPLRSNRVTRIHEVQSQGGASNPVTGEVYVSFAADPHARVVRMHEPLHLDFTRNLNPKDLMDQGIEDARLHRHCSATKQVAEQGWPQARQDELETAHKDILSLQTSEPLDAVIALRSVGILGSDISAEQSATIEAHFGPEFRPTCERALSLLSSAAPDVKQWRKVRRLLSKYFDENRAEEKEKPKGPDPDESGDFPLPGRNPVQSGKRGTQNSEPSKDSQPSKTQSKRRKKMAKPVVPQLPRRTSSKPNLKEYVNPTTGLSDLSEQDSLIPAIPDYLKRTPLSVSIHRLDMSTGSVPNVPGREAYAAQSGARIYSVNRIIESRFNPNTRVFARQGGHGGGSILIDASGSMNIPIETLEAFCKKLPAATIALYNALETFDKILGNLYIFAANNRRATRIPRYGELNWGGDNYIDYQVLRWLLRQDGPRYLVTDFQYTGYWRDVAHQLAIAAYKRNLFTPIKSLDDMRLALTRSAHSIAKPIIGRKWSEPALIWPQPKF